MHARARTHTHVHTYTHTHTHTHIHTHTLLKLSQDCSAEDKQSCSQVLLERQVGSRYFVSALNAAKIAKASLKFLEYTVKDSGNNLERTVYNKLRDPTKADALMFTLI